LEYTVGLGRGWKRDEHGLAGKGSISIDADTVNLSGKQQTALLFKVLLWSLTAMMVANVSAVVYANLFSVGEHHRSGLIAMLIVGLALTVTVATLLTRYFGSSPYSLKFKRNNVLGVTRAGNFITIKASSQGSSVTFKALSEQDAQDIENEIKNIMKIS
jgi:hypothetical protein